MRSSQMSHEGEEIHLRAGRKVGLCFCSSSLKNVLLAVYHAFTKKSKFVKKLKNPSIDMAQGFSTSLKGVHELYPPPFLFPRHKNNLLYRSVSFEICYIFLDRKST